MNYTPKQLQILRMIYDYQQENGYSPTYAELARQLGVSTITVFEHLEALERKGAIRRRRHEARSVEITEPTFLRQTQQQGRMLPVRGAIAAASRSKRLRWTRRKNCRFRTCSTASRTATCCA